MSDQFDPATKPPLGVGGLLSRSVRLYFRKFILFFMLAFVPLLIVNLLSNAVIGDQMATAVTNPNPADPFAMFTPGYFAVTALSMLSLFVIIGLITLAAHDAGTGRPVTIGAYVGQTIKSLPAIVVLAILAMIASYVGMVFLLIPGIYIMGMFSVMVPAILVEGVGFRGLGRSMSLTKHFRWPVVGAMILMVLVTILISIPVTLLTTFFSEQVFFTGGGMFLLGVVSALTTAVGYGIMSVFVALLYARLREIKDGVSMENLAEVFG